MNISPQAETITIRETCRECDGTGLVEYEVKQGFMAYCPVCDTDRYISITGKCVDCGHSQDSWKKTKKSNKRPTATQTIDKPVPESTNPCPFCGKGVKRLPSHLPNCPEKP